MRQLLVVLLLTSLLMAQSPKPRTITVVGDITGRSVITCTDTSPKLQRDAALTIIGVEHDNGAVGNYSLCGVNLSLRIAHKYKLVLVEDEQDIISEGTVSLKRGTCWTVTEASRLSRVRY